MQRPFRVTRVVPIASMADSLVSRRADLGNRRACTQALIDGGYLASDIEFGLEAAIAQAAEIRATTSTIPGMVAELASLGVFLVAVGLWAIGLA